MTEKTMINHLRLMDLYKTEKEYWNNLKMIEMINVKLWYNLWNNFIQRQIQEKIVRKIRRYKNFCKKSNKKQYIKFYK